MNQAKIWLVVNPNHGLPLLLGSVTIIALLVHFAVLTHTTWFSGYWNGRARTAAITAPAAPVATADAAR